MRVFGQPAACDGFGVGVQKSRIQQLANHVAKPACGVEVVHVCQPVWIDPRHERCDLGQVREIFPIEDDPPCPRHCDQVDQQVCRPARGV